MRHALFQKAGQSYAENEKSTIFAENFFQFLSMNLVTVGTLAFDDIETPWGRAEKVVGGACTYIALAASYFVRPIGVVSVIGDDFPEETLDDMRRRGIDFQGLQVRHGEKSFFWAGRYHRDLNTRDTLDTQ